MINLLLWATMILSVFGLIILGYRLFGIVGLYSFTIFSIIIANILVLKRIEVMGIAVTTGAIVFSASFLVTDILSEIYGRAKAKVAVYLGFWSMIVFVFLAQLGLAFVPSARDWASPHMEALFSVLPRILVASLIAYMMSNLHDVWAYEFWKKKFPEVKHIWIRNNASTVVSQIIDSTLFVFISFYGKMPTPVLIQLIFTTYIFKVIVAFSDTPFVYLAHYIHSKGKAGMVPFIAKE